MIKKEVYPLSGWMKACFYLVAFSASLSISSSQIGLGVIIIYWIVLMIKEKRIIIADTPMTRPMLYYLAALALSSLFGGGVFRNLISIIHNHWIMLIFFATVTFINDTDTIKKLVYALLGGAVVASVYGITQGFLGGLDIIRPVGEKIITGDAIGFFDHHLTYAEVLLFSIFLSLSLLLFTREAARGDEKLTNYKESFLYIIVFLLSTAALLFSQTRSSWLGFFGALFLMTLVTLAAGKRKVTMACLALLLAFMALLYLPQFRTRAYSIAQATTRTESNPRYFIWRVGLKVFKANPITGVGTDNWPQAVSPYVEVDPVISNHAHNNLIHQAATGGVVGLLAFIYIWVVLFREGFTIYLNVSDDDYFIKGLILGGLGGITAFHGAGLFESSFTDSEVAMVLWLVTGLIFAAGASLKEKIS